jgi:hypothetical protein
MAAAGDPQESVAQARLTARRKAVALSSCVSLLPARCPTGGRVGPAVTIDAGAGARDRLPVPRRR